MMYAEMANTANLDVFDFDFSLPEVRRKFAVKHPMLDRKYIVTTDQLTEFYEVAYDWVVARKSGLYCAGLERTGKTTAIEYAIDVLRQELPFVAIRYLSGQRNPNQKKDSFCAQILEEWKFSIGKLRGARPATVLANYLMTACAELGGRHCVIFIDEAQLFSVIHYRYLLELWNSLAKEGYLLCTILVGQPQIRSLKSLTKELDHGAVVSRFFVKLYQIGGLKNVAALQIFLSHYDSELVYPAGSDWSFSRFFLQKAYDNGWRIEQEAPRFWASLENVSKAKQSSIRASGFRIAWIVDAIHTFLLDGMPRDSKEFKGTQNLWSECLLAGTEADLIL